MNFGSVLLKYTASSESKQNKVSVHETKQKKHDKKTWEKNKGEN